MLSFKRKYSTHVQRNAFLFTLVCFIFVIIIAGLQVAFFDEFVTKLVNKNIFGQYVAWGHIVILIAIFLCALIGLFLSKKGIIAYSINEISNHEIVQYNQKYGASFSLVKGKYLPPFGIIFATVIFPILYLFFVFNLIPEDTNLVLLKFMHVIFFIIMCLLFYETIKRMMRKGSGLMLEVFQHANKAIPHTKIRLEGQDFEATFRKINFALNVDGLFKGQDFSIDYGVSGFSYGKRFHTSTIGGVSLKLKVKPKLNFSISENKAALYKITGETLDECFKKRFNLKGVSVKKLPDDFKQKLLESSRTVDIKLKDGCISQGLVNLAYLPFYSAQGMILFLDFLIDLENDLINEAA